MEKKNSQHREGLIAALVISIFATILFLGVALALMAAPLWAPLMLGLIAGGGLISAVVFAVLLANFDEKVKAEKERTDSKLQCIHCKCSPCDFGMEYIQSTEEKFPEIVRERLTHCNAPAETIERLLPIYSSVKNGSCYDDSDCKFLENGDLETMVSTELRSLSIAYREHFPQPGRVTFTSAMRGY
jgi:hypothetical protein